MRFQALEGMRDMLSAFWQEREVRERKAIILAGVAILLTLIWLLLLNPPLVGRVQLDKSLPVLRQQAAELQGMAGEAARLTQQAAPPAMPLTRESVEASLARQGLKARTVLVTGDMLKVELTSASFAALMTWLDDMGRSARTTVVESAIDVQPAVDTVNAAISLRQQSSDK
jgi:general secretion pathway protein M